MGWGTPAEIFNRANREIGGPGGGFFSGSFGEKPFVFRE